MRSKHCKYLPHDFILKVTSLSGVVEWMLVSERIKKPNAANRENVFKGTWATLILGEEQGSKCL